MQKVFADSVYWIAVINRRDQWYERVQIVSARLSKTRLVTTNEVLIETLNYYAERGENKRDAVAKLIRSILLDITIEVVVLTETGFLEGLTFYQSRRDKGYSLTDCISMNICREQDIIEVLTPDHHFEQEGFRILL